MSYQSPCPEWAEKLALRQEDLTPYERAELDTHIRACPACSVTRSEYSKLIARLQTLTSPAMTQSVKFPIQTPSHIGSLATPTNKRAQTRYSPWKGISNMGDKNCQMCGFIDDANGVYCGNCGYPLDGSETGHPTAAFQGLQQVHITRILADNLGDTLPTFTAPPLSQPKRNTIVLTVLALMLISALFAGIQLGIDSTQVNVSNTPITSNPSGTLPVSNPTATPTPTPSLTPVPQPGTVLYQENGLDNWRGWEATGPDWVVQDGKLLNTNGKGTPLFTAPYDPGMNNIADYAIEVKMTLVGYVGSDHGGFGLVVRATPDGGGYTLSLCAVSGRAFGPLYADDRNDNNLALLLSGQRFPDGVSLARMAFTPHFNFEYTYRMEVKANTVRVLIDGRVVIPSVTSSPGVPAWHRPVLIDGRVVIPSETDNTYLFGGQVGIWSSGYQLSISSFTVIAL